MKACQLLPVWKYLKRLLLVPLRINSFFLDNFLFIHTFSPKNYKHYITFTNCFFTLYTMYMTFAFTISDFAAHCGCCSKSIMPIGHNRGNFDYRQCACKCHIISIFTISTIFTTYLT